VRSSWWSRPPHAQALPRRADTGPRSIAAPAWFATRQRICARLVASSPIRRAIVPVVQPDPDAPVLVSGHGASGSAASMAPHVAGLRSRGIDARAIDLPRGRAERAMPLFAALLAGGLAAGGAAAEIGRAHV